MGSVLDQGRGDEPFPRGGGSAISPLDIRRAGVDAARDVFESSQRPTSKRKRKNHSEKKDSTGLESAKTPRTRIEPFMLSKIKAGTLVLGQVIEKPTGSNLVVSLPGNLVGYVSEGIDSARVGQWLRFVVTGVGEAPHHHLQLSLDPGLVNQTISDADWRKGQSVQARVESVEDRGSVLDFGNNRLGFSSAQLEEGTVILGTIDRVKSRVTTVSPLGETMKDAEILDTVESLDSLVPGAIIKGVVVDRRPLGLVVEVAGRRPVGIDAIHSIGADEETDDILVRVLWSHPAPVGGQRKLGFTLELDLPSLSSDKLAVGEVLDTQVTKIIPGVGIILDAGSGIKGFAHISHLRDEHVTDEAVEKLFTVGSEHRARIIGNCSADQLWQFTLKPSQLDQRYLVIGDVHIGDIVTDATVERRLAGGSVVVNLGGVSALASELHISDSHRANPELQLKPGKRVAARVIDVQPAAHRILVSLKKSVVETDLPILSSYDQSPEFQGTTVGTVVALKPRGATIEFFGGVHGFLPASGTSGTVKLGQTVKVRILDAIPSTRRLVVSNKAPQAVTSPGEVLTTTIVALSKESVRVTSENGSEFDVLLSHLADESPRRALKKLNVGDELTVRTLTGAPGGVTAKKSLIEAPLLFSIDSLELNHAYSGWVVRADASHGLFVAFPAPTRLVGLIPATELPSDISKWPVENASLRPRVAKIRNGRISLTLVGEQASSESPSPGDVVDAVVTSVKQTQLNVTIGSRQGRVDVSQLWDRFEDIPDPAHPLSAFKRGDVLKGIRVIGFHDARTHRFLPLTNRSGGNIVLELSRVEPVVDISNGDTVVAFVNNATADGQALWMTVSPTLRGRISRLDVGRELPDVGAAVRCKVVGVDPLLLTAMDIREPVALVHKVDATRLVVRLPAFETGVIKDTEAFNSPEDFEPLAHVFKRGDITPYTVRDGLLCIGNGSPWSMKNLPSENEVVRGFIRNIADGGVFVDIGNDLVGRVQIGQISDSYLQDWRKAVSIGNVVAAKVVRVSGSQVELSLRHSVVTGETQAQPGLDHVEVGSVWDGVVRRVTDFGVFVTLKGTPLSGLCHKSEVADLPIADIAKVFSVGDSVRVKVLSVDTAKRQISLGMKSSYFASDSEEDSEDEAGSPNWDESNGDNSDGDEDEYRDNTTRLKEGEEIMNFVSDSDSGVEDVEADTNESSDDQATHGLTAGWDIGDIGQPLDSDSDDDDEEDRQPRKRRKREKFVEDRTAKLAHQLPQSVEDFERLLVSQPDSSVLWMNYMALQLQLGDVDAARSVARRALRTIPQRGGETERFNMWMALLNLEVTFGTQETLQNTFREAVQYNDPIALHMKLAGILHAAGRNDEARDTWRQTIRKHGGESLEVWRLYARFLYETGRASEARNSLPGRAMQQLPRRLHRDMGVQLAKLEYELGDSERGRTLFEALVATYRRRPDLWSVYIDQEIRTGDRTRITALFERVLLSGSVKLSMKQASYFFKKWLAFEVECGDSDSQAAVKAKASNYVAEHDKARE